MSYFPNLYSSHFFENDSWSVSLRHSFCQQPLAGVPQAQLFLAHPPLSSPPAAVCSVRFACWFPKQDPLSIAFSASTRRRDTCCSRLEWEKTGNAYEVGTNQMSSVLAVALHSVARHERQALYHAYPAPATAVDAERTTELSHLPCWSSWRVASCVFV